MVCEGYVGVLAWRRAGDDDDDDDFLGWWKKKCGFDRGGSGVNLKSWARVSGGSGDKNAPGWTTPGKEILSSCGRGVVGADFE
jgi:hypothetical protein